MRIALACLLAAGLAASASAQDSKPTDAPAKADPKVAPQPDATPAVKAIPVPDGPVVKKSEIQGIIIEDIKIGDGYEVKPGGAVVANYHGTLKSTGAVFDSSFERGEPIAFPLSGVIEGWKLGVPGMKVGGVRRLTIPAALAYGDRSPSDKIPANSDLVFVIELTDALEFEDVKVGDGPAPTGTYVAVTTHVMKDDTGKEIDKADAANPYVWVPNEFMAMQLALDGMKVGGKRVCKHIPKEMMQSNPQIPSNRPQSVSCSMEVELVAVRNLPGRPGGR